MALRVTLALVSLAISSLHKLLTIVATDPLNNTSGAVAIRSTAAHRRGVNVGYNWLGILHRTGCFSQDSRLRRPVDGGFSVRFSIFFRLLTECVDWTVSLTSS